MKIIFAGTPEFALPTLHALFDSKHEVCAVYTQPDRPAGRGRKLTQSPVKTWALTHHLPLYQPNSLKETETQKKLRELQADIMVNVAYGLILPQTVLDIPKFGCINIHPSLLPKFRGAAPIQRAIMSGESVTGVTIMKMDAGLDTGDIYKQTKVNIYDADTTASILQKTATIGTELLLEVLDEIESGIAKPIPQNSTHATYADKISKEEAKINWHKSAKEIDCLIRAFNPWPIAYTEINNKCIRIWAAKLKDTDVKTHGCNLKPGTIIKADKNGIDVATENGVLTILTAQLAGAKPIAALDLLNAHKNDFAPNKILA